MQDSLVSAMTGFSFCAAFLPRSPAGFVWLMLGSLCSVLIAAVLFTLGQRHQDSATDRGSRITSSDAEADALLSHD